MNTLLEKIEKDMHIFWNIRDKLDPLHVENYQEVFRIDFAHHSTALEGNTLSLIQTKLLLSDHIPVKGKDLREIYEVVNHEKAFSYVITCVKKRKELNEEIINTIHKTVMENIAPGGIYRTIPVWIGGSNYEPPSVSEMLYQMKEFYRDISFKCMLEATELAAWTHAQFTKIHPYADGNGRTARLIMNYQLMDKGLLPINIRMEDRERYLHCLEKYSLQGKLQPLQEMIMQLEEKELHRYLEMAVGENLLDVQEIE